ncbi:protein of unknown function (plasmid) [Cupriavidus taiwanensis]|uniref:Uncharacterized protein n=1 Tax=Cupriavidus taiwanensis TaxID=164546 RepID=A0A375FIW1_9BURK|nr:protein of unknown function [Cupriavidus taiwanensis]SOZ74793.1 protein of unknown function [Cupriavidus taiwanensis]SPA11520.1 protein of unknown function [Cupriavidus taiwanensis]SPA57425.1 protein of unknown function [Cupriavidus taiwanensis]SPD49253.1 protein of unknown function [Cupriavidus taiwanensis]
MPPSKSGAPVARLALEDVLAVVGAEMILVAEVAALEVIDLRGITGLGEEHQDLEVVPSIGSVLL